MEQRLKDALEKVAEEKLESLRSANIRGAEEIKQLVATFVTSYDAATVPISAKEVLDKGGIIRRGKIQISGYGDEATVRIGPMETRFSIPELQVSNGVTVRVLLIIEPEPKTS